VCPRGALRIETLGLDNEGKSGPEKQHPDRVDAKSGSSGDSGQAA
jgi:hypothetical protein